MAFSTSTLLEPPPPEKQRGKFAKLGITCLSVVGAVILGFALSSGFFEAIRPPAPKPIGGPTLTRDPWIDVWSTKLCEAYRADAALANRKYQGRLVHVGGRVTGMGNDLFDRPYVMLGSGEPGVMEVQCLLSDEAVVPAAQLKRGQFVVIAGQVQGMKGSVEIGPCRIYEVR